LGSFCFAPAKNLGALGKAGALITNDAITAENARRIRLNGDNLPRDTHLAWSRSRFMDEIQAAILRVKLPLLEEWNLNRRMIAQTYTICFDDLAADLNCVSQINGSVFQHYVIRTKHRDLLQKNLLENGIGSTVHYPAPDYVYTSNGQGDEQWKILPGTENACAEVLSLPCYPELNPWEIERICGSVKQSLAEIDE
jgi:dTDP-4-amino-4,6-dideoxygalactose transaminase